MLGGLDDEKKEDTKNLYIFQQIAIQVASVMLNSKVVHLREHQQSIMVVRSGNVAISYPQLRSQEFLSVSLEQPKMTLSIFNCTTVINCIDLVFKEQEKTDLFIGTYFEALWKTGSAWTGR